LNDLAFDEALSCRGQVLDQANNGSGFFMLPVEWEQGGFRHRETLRIPKEPFLLWSQRIYGDRNAPLFSSWKSVSESGMKTDGDNPMHTDWMIGAGLKPWEAYENTPFNDALERAAAIQAAEFHGMNPDALVVLYGSNVIKGTAYHPGIDDEVPSEGVAVIPRASADYLAATLTAGAVITEQGGELCHLVEVAGQLEKTIVRCDNALTAFPPGHVIDLSPEAEPGL